jgi:mono/diheme cytochrome c family protein
VRFRACLATVLIAFAAGCGGDDEEPAEPEGGGASAQQLFTDNCGNCHTLAAAGAAGKVGPDLDQLRPGPDLVNTQVTNGGGGMPPFKGKLSPEQIQQISDYVAENAGQS